MQIIEFQIIEKGQTCIDTSLLKFYIVEGLSMFSINIPNQHMGILFHTCFSASIRKMPF